MDLQKTIWDCEIESYGQFSVETMKMKTSVVWRISFEICLSKYLVKQERMVLKFTENASSWRTSLAQLQTDSISYMINGQISSEVLAWFSWTAIEKITGRVDVPSFKALFNFSIGQTINPDSLLLYSFSVWCCQSSINKHMVSYVCKPNFLSGRNILDLLFYFWSIFLLSKMFFLGLSENSILFVKDHSFCWDLQHYLALLNML